MRHETSRYRRISKQTVLRLPIYALAFTVVGLGWSAYAFVSLQTGAKPFSWGNPTVNFVIHEAADPAIADGSDETAVRLGFQAWDQVPASTIAFVEDQSPQSRARTDWRSDDIHLVIWDTTNESGFFGGAAGLVAITPVDFDPSSGAILDADIIFNAKNYTFSTDMTPGTFDVQGIATHEVGHLIGLDHSAIVGATMNPFANQNDTRLRSLEDDDRAAAWSVYPLYLPGAVTGKLTRQDGTPISGAHVVAEDSDGNPASATLTDGAGNFAIRGLDQGQYVIYAEPLDGPVRSNNFSTHTSGLTVDTDFGTTFYGSGTGQSSPVTPQAIQVLAGQVSALTHTLVARSKLPTPMNVNNLSLTTVMPGQAAILTAYGTGLGSSTTVVVPGTGIFTSNPSATANSASCEMEVTGSTQPQLRTVRVINEATGDCAVLTGGFEVRLPGPVASGITPAKGAPGVTAQVTVSNADLGARVIFGNQVLTATQTAQGVSFTVPNMPNGTYTVCVENPDGQFAVLKNAFAVENSVATTPPPAPTTPNSVPTTTTPTSSGAPAASTPSASSPSGSLPAPSSGGGGGGGGGCQLTPESSSPWTALLALMLLGG
ncbi:MAG: carboxypeptidase regulatory-like domain-containing protein, partial [Planctomycetota bacterium]